MGGEGDYWASDFERVRFVVFRLSRWRCVVTLEVGDWVEIICPPEHISDDLSLKPKQRGIVTAYDGIHVHMIRVGFMVRFRSIESYSVNFSGEHAHCQPHCLRKVPVDDGRQVVNWDWHSLNQPTVKRW